MDRGAWWPTVHWVAKSWTQLKWLNTWIHIEKTHHRNHSGTALSLPKYLVVTRGETVSLQWRIQANDVSAKWSGLPSRPAAHTTSCIPRYNVIRTRDHISAASFPVLHWHLIMKKHQISPNRRTCYKMIDWSQGHKREERLENHQRREETKETWWLNMMRSWPDPWREKWHHWKNHYNPENFLVLKYALWIHTMVT